MKKIYIRYVAVILALVLLFAGSAGAKIDNGNNIVVEGKAWLNLSYHIQSIGKDRVMVKVVAENTGTITAKQVEISLSNYINGKRGQMIVTVGVAPINVLYGGQLVGSSSIKWTGEIKPREKHEIKYIAETGDLKGDYFLTQLRYTYLKTSGSRFGYAINLREGKGDVVCLYCIP